MLKDVSNTLQNFKFMEATVFEIALVGPADPPTPGKRFGYQKAW